LLLKNFVTHCFIKSYQNCVNTYVPSYDTLTGFGGWNFIAASSGNISLDGGDGNDYLGNQQSFNYYGGLSSNVIQLIGGAGDDTLKNAGGYISFPSQSLGMPTFKLCLTFKSVKMNLFFLMDTPSEAWQ
jgi:hypothetical protein